MLSGIGRGTEMEAFGLFGRVEASLRLTSDKCIAGNSVAGSEVLFM